MESGEALQSSGEGGAAVRSGARWLAMVDERNGAPVAKALVGRRSGEDEVKSERRGPRAYL